MNAPIRALPGAGLSEPRWWACSAITANTLQISWTAEQMHCHELILQLRTEGNCYQLVLGHLLTTPLFNLRMGKVKRHHGQFWKHTEAWKQDKASSASSSTPAPSGKHCGRWTVQALATAQQPLCGEGVVPIRLRAQHPTAERDAGRLDCLALCHNRSSSGVTGQPS